MKGTRLWQEARSPLISGRSKRERPFWAEVLGGWVVSVLAVATFVVVSARSSATGFAKVGGAEVPRTALLLVGASAFAVVPALLGAVVGAWAARNMGWKRAWISGAALGILFGVVWLALSATST